jgi:hypothetical protein
MNAQKIAGNTNVQEIANFHSKNKNTPNCVSSHEEKWTILTKATLQNISIAPKPKTSPLESPQATSQIKKSISKFNACTFSKTGNFATWKFLASQTEDLRNFSTHVTTFHDLRMTLTTNGDDI